MKPKYEMKQMVAYWNGEIGSRSRVMVSHVCEIHQIDESVEYKLKRMDAADFSIEEESMYKDIKSLKEAIQVEAEHQMSLMFSDCKTRFDLAQLEEK